MGHHVRESGSCGTLKRQIVLRHRLNELTRYILTSGALATAILCVPSTSIAQTSIYSNLGPGNAYNPSAWFVVSGPSSSAGAGHAFTPAMEFTSHGTFDLAQIDLGLANDSGTNSASVSLWTNAGGTPGTMLGDWSISGQPTNSTITPQPLTTIRGITGVSLTPASYFLVVAPGAGNTNDAWHWNSSGALGEYMFSANGGAFQDGGTQKLAAFDILGNATAGTQTTYALGGGSVTYYGFAPQPLGNLGYDVTTIGSSVSANGVTLVQTDGSHPALVFGQDNNGPLTVTFVGNPSSITSVVGALDVYHVGPSQAGNVSLDTSGTTGGNTFAVAHGYAVDVEADAGNATVILGADTISSVSGDGLRVSVGNGSAAIATAANITAGNYGINTGASGVLSVAVSGSVSGTLGSVLLDGSGQNTLTLNTGATLTGNAVGSTESGATNALVLQGSGATNNNFVNFGILNVSATGVWALNGVSTISETTVTAGNLKVGDISHQSAVLTSNIVVDPGATLSGYGKVVGSVTGSQSNLMPGDGALTITGNLIQNGGNIIFEINPDGSGGFDESKLILNPGQTISIDNADIIFDFLNGADPDAFLKSGQFNIDTFFQSSSGHPFSDDFDLSNVFLNDSFDAIASNYEVTDFAFSPGGGATALSEVPVPEPATLSVFVMGLLGVSAFRRRHKAKA